jgi:hypothetical protein
MSPPRTKAQRRQHIFAFQGNAQVFEAVIGLVRLGQLCHPNRLLKTFRSSNKGRRIA